MANSVDPDQMSYSVASDLGVHCLLRHVSPNTKGVGVVGCGKGDGYLTSLGHPTDIGFQLGKACYPFSRQG